MNREIKFRALNTKDKMVYGNLLSKSAIGKWGNSETYEYSDIKPETIGQFTGLKDRNGKEIYEGDIVSGNLIVKTGIYEMHNDRSGFPTWIGANALSSIVLVCDKNYQIREEVIGNIYEKKD